jgi:hypothetical protein
MSNDKKIIRTTLIILFLSLFVIYTFYFQQKNSDTTESITPDTTQETITYTENDTFSGDEVQTGSEYTTGTDREEVIDTGDNDEDRDILTPSFENREIVYTGENTNGITWFEDIIKNLPKLSGTTEYFGDMQMTQVLWLTAEYTLTDSTWIYYAYMKDVSEDELESIVQKLSGDMYTLRTELEIKQNELYGDAITFINIPEVTFTQKPTVQRKIVFMVVQIGNDRWFVQMPITIYYKSKEYLKTLFTESYE